jgi:hypothetical protein|tara:strand:+ start:206 stop:367 length:162 start_codon:yes stop_codon:yes gene_type:complete
MNQTNAKELVLTPTDARNIHSDLFALLTKINDLTNIQKEDNQAVNVDFDGGDF